MIKDTFNNCHPAIIKDAYQEFNLIENYIRREGQMFVNTLLFKHPDDLIKDDCRNCGVDIEVKIYRGLEKCYTTITYANNGKLIASRKYNWALSACQVANKVPGIVASTNLKNLAKIQKSWKIKPITNEHVTTSWDNK